MKNKNNKLLLPIKFDFLYMEQSAKGQNGVNFQQKILSVNSKRQTNKFRILGYYSVKLTPLRHRPNPWQSAANSALLFKSQHKI